MEKRSKFLSLIGLVLILALIVPVIRTCANEPTISPTKFASTLVVMRSDMSAAVAIGGVVTDFDDNRKTQINRISIYTGIRSDSWNKELRDGYIGVLLQRGWGELKETDARTMLCKDGALAEVARATGPLDDTGKNGFVSMAFSPATIVQCSAVKQVN